MSALRGLWPPVARCRRAAVADQPGGRDDSAALSPASCPPLHGADRWRCSVFAAAARRRIPRSLGAVCADRLRRLLLDRPPPGPDAAAGRVRVGAARSTRWAGCRSALHRTLALADRPRRCSCTSQRFLLRHPFRWSGAGFVLFSRSRPGSSLAASPRSFWGRAFTARARPAQACADLRLLPRRRPGCSARCSAALLAAPLCSRRLTAPAASPAAPSGAGRRAGRACSACWWPALLAAGHRSAEYTLLAEENRVNQRLLIPPRGRILDRLGRPLAAMCRPTACWSSASRPATSGRRCTASPALVILPSATDRGRAARGARRAPRLHAGAGARGSDLGARWRGSRSTRRTCRACCSRSGLLRDYPHGPDAGPRPGLCRRRSTRPSSRADRRSAAASCPTSGSARAAIERSYDSPLRGRAGAQPGRGQRRRPRDPRARPRRGRARAGSRGWPSTCELQRFCDRAAGERAGGLRRRARRAHRRACWRWPRCRASTPACSVGGLAAAQWRELRDDPRTPLVNKAIRGQYPPGSTFKIDDRAGGARGRRITPDHEVFCPGYIEPRRRHASIAGRSTATAGST